MPVNVVKCTMRFSIKNQGWAESHLLKGVTELGTGSYQAAVGLAKRRAPLLGFGATIDSVRLSVEGVFRDIQLIDPDDFVNLSPKLIIYSKDSTGATTRDNTVDAYITCVLCRAQALSTQNKSIFLGGPPDLLIVGSPPKLDLNSVPGWNNAFKNYRSELIANWGFKVRAVTAQVKIQNILTDGDTSETQIVTKTGATTFAVGDLVQVRNCQRTNVALKTVNGKWQVSKVTVDALNSTTTYNLRNSQGIDPTKITKMGTIEPIDYGVGNYTDVVTIGPGEHKRGKPFGQRPGRRKVLKPLT
jgi:hypothetical protein